VNVGAKLQANQYPWLAAGALAVVFSACNVASAAIVTISFSGEITSVTDSQGKVLRDSGFDTKVDTFTGYISYDTAASPTSTSTVTYLDTGVVGDRAFYDNTESVVTVDGYDFSVGDGLIIDDFDAGLNDFYGEASDSTKYSDRLWKSTGAPVEYANCIGSIVTCQFNIRLFDWTGTFLSDTALPSDLDLSDFDVHDIRIVGIVDSSDRYEINGTITSLSVSMVPVPVPAAAWLFASALLGVVAMRRGKAAR
jgi:hypothetical protein